MKTLLTLTLILAASLVRAQVCNPVCANQPAQCCNQPQADLFSALEPSTHDAPGSTFRGLMPINQLGAPCAVDSTITNLLDNIQQPGALFESVNAPALGGLLFSIRERLQFGVITGIDAGTDLKDACFKLDVKGFSHPSSPIMFTDGCGPHTFAIGQPKYACILGPPISKTLVCFGAKELGTKAPLPPGFDRLEDVCVLVNIL
jgi:hypothetical protein